MDLLLGIDIGTTGTKSMIVDTEGTVLSSAYKGYKLYNDRPGWAEQDADDWWNAVVYTVNKCITDKDIRDNIRAVSISSQGGSLVPVDDKGIPLRRAISWMDKRGGKQRDELNRHKAEDYYYNLTGSKLSDGGNLIQIKWIGDNEPQIYSKVYKFLSTIDYINFKLTGRYAIDATNAAMTQLLNISSKTWDDGILRLLGITDKSLPSVQKSGEPLGYITNSAAEQLDLNPETLVVCGGHDQYCAALGAGALNSGDVVLSTGTAWVVLCIADKLVLDAGNNFYAGSHVAEGLWGLLGSVETGGVCMEWLRNNILSVTNGNKEIFAEEFAEIDKMASKKNPGSDGLMFYPYFTGAECPNWAPKNKGTFTGLDLSHDKYHLARAIMEGVCYEIKWMLEEIENKGIKTSQVKMFGGASKSSLWPDLTADITGVPVRISEINDAACIGATILAGKGAGLFKSEEEGYRNMSKGEKEILPNLENVLEYRRLFDKYKKGFNNIKQLYLIDETQVNI